MNILKMTPEEKLKIQEEHKRLEKQEQDRKNELKKGLQKPEPKKETTP